MANPEAIRMFRQTVLALTVSFHCRPGVSPDVLTLLAIITGMYLLRQYSVVKVQRLFPVPFTIGIADFFSFCPAISSYFFQHEIFPSVNG